MRHDGADRRRRARTPLGLLVACATILAVALGVPTDVLTLVGGVAPGPDAELPEPIDTSRASVSTPGDAGSGVGTDQATEDAAAPGAAARWEEPARRPSGGALHIEELRGGWRVEAGAEEAAALGVLAAHAWARRAAGAGGQGAGVTAPGVVATLEAVERPGPSHAVVTVLVASGADVQRVAVPIVFRDLGPAVAGAPWRLPSPSTDPVEVAGGAVEDELLIAAARDALERVGIAGSRLQRLEVTDGWPFVAHLDGDADGAPWLRWHVDRFVVTGLPLDRAEDRTRIGSRAVRAE